MKSIITLLTFIFLLNSLSAQFSTEQIIHNLSSGEYGYAEDMDNDGDKDFISFGSIWTGVSWFRNIDGAGNFSTQIELNIPLPSNGWFHGSIGDLNGDGFIDIIIVEQNDDEVSWYPHLDGLGTFGDKIVIDISSNESYVATASDIDNDGDVDLIVGGKPSLVWYENTDGQGQFSGPKIIATIASAIFHYVENIDIDGDGFKDLVIGATNKIGWYKNENGQGFSGFKGMPNSYQGNTEMHVVDIDGDNDYDVVYEVDNVFTSETELRWYENIDGLGDWGLGGTIDSDVSIIQGITSLDVDLDGDMDIISADYWIDQVNWYENLDGLGNFDQKNTISDQIDEVYLVGTADINGDSVKDLFTISTGKILWFQNLASSPRIQISTFWDENENMIKETNEIGLNQQNIEVMPNNLNTFSLDQGFIEFPVNAGSYEINCSPSNGWTLTTPANLNIDVQGNQSTIQYFGLKPQGELFEAEVSLTSSPTRCGFTVPFWLTYSNTSNQVFDAEVTLTLDDLVTLISTDIPPSQSNGNQLSWFIQDLNPTESGQIMFELIIPGVDYLGEYLNFFSSISLIDNSGTTVFNGENEYQPQINCAYDPNDKLVSPVVIYEGENYTLFDQTLEYTIRFQNTGTDTAFNIQVTDQLDQNLDWSTFKPLSSSHSYTVSLNETGLVDFRFNNILLPDSSTNLIGSQGFIKYKINSKVDILENTIIENTASIFFDFNPPIITNTTENIMVSEFPFEVEPENTNSELSFSFQPNPSSGTVNINFELEKLQPWEIQLTNSVGTLIRSYSGETSGLKNHTLYFPGLPIGVYYLTLFADNTSKTEKLIIVN